MREAGGKEIEVRRRPRPRAAQRKVPLARSPSGAREPGRLKDLARRGSLAIQRVPGASSLSVLIDVDPVGLM